MVLLNGVSFAQLRNLSDRLCPARLPVRYAHYRATTKQSRMPQREISPVVRSRRLIGRTATKRSSSVWWLSLAKEFEDAVA